MQALKRGIKRYGGEGGSPTITNTPKRRHKSKTKRNTNGGFGGEPTVGMTTISQERWDMINWSNDGKN